MRRLVRQQLTTTIADGGLQRPTRKIRASLATMYRLIPATKGQSASTVAVAEGNVDLAVKVKQRDMLRRLKRRRYPNTLQARFVEMLVWDQQQQLLISCLRCQADVGVRVCKETRRRVDGV